MGIKLGDISPLAGAVTGKGMFGKGLSKLAESGMGMLVPMSYLAKHQRDKNEKEDAAGTRVNMPKSGMMGARGMAAEIARRAGVTGDDRTTMKKGGKVIKKMAKGGKVSSASKRADGCATKGKTKGRFV